jgi:hypothetical protein
MRVGWGDVLQVSRRLGMAVRKDSTFYRKTESRALYRKTESLARSPSKTGASSLSIENRGPNLPSPTPRASLSIEN